MIRPTLKVILAAFVMKSLALPLAGTLPMSLSRQFIPLTLLLSLTPAMLSAGDWLRFRGPNGTGVATAPGLPVEWTAKDAAWETLLSGIGHSSPVVRSDRLFVAAASEDGSERDLVCLNVSDGTIRWTRSLALQADKLHPKNSHASATPAASEEAVFISFADDKRHIVAAFDHDGNPLWKRDLGPFESQHGHGASPIVWHDLVIVPNDQDGPSAVVALDIRTGDDVWKADRPAGNTAYGTPLVIEEPGKSPQLISSSQASGITSLDPLTGRANWHTGGLPQRTVGSPVYAGGLVFQSCGQAGRGVLMIGADPFATADGKRIVFEEKKVLPYVPTPVAFKNLLFLWTDNGIVLALDLKTLKPVWDEPKRVDGNFSASPVCVNGNLYAVSEEGEVVVARASKDFE
ncbi:MAG: PQQ-like beta-propeller repeat protein, partial [Planctomycetota bacterium]|nr:PQQ-like beta-propeller repeat protein [Planctomycetota bacterium]